MKTTIDKFEKKGFWTQISEVEILGLSGCTVEERRYVVMVKTPGTSLRQFNFKGDDAKKRAIAHFEFEKSFIQLNVK